MSHVKVANVQLRKRGLVWALWGALLFMALPYVFQGVHFWYVFNKPASDYVSIEYITASDIGHDGIQYMEMCRHVDEQRQGEWTWELSLFNTERKERIWSSTSGAVMEVAGDCLVTWNSSRDGPYNDLVRSLKNGRYQWDVIVSFDVDYGIRKTLSAQSNVFTKRTILTD